VTRALRKVWITISLTQFIIPQSNQYLAESHCWHNAREVERDPDLYDALELAIPAAKIAAQPASSGTTRKRQTQVSEETYRKQINRILKQAYWFSFLADDRIEACKKLNY